MNEGGGVQRLPRLLLRELGSRELAQFIVDKKQQLIGAMRLARLQGVQQIRDVRHAASLPDDTRAVTTIIRLRQYRKHPNRELPEVGDVNRSVVVVIEVGQKAGLAGVQTVARRKQSEVGDVHPAVAVGVAKVAEQSLGIADDVVPSGSAVAVAVERDAGRANLAGQSGERIAAIGERAELGFGAGEVA